MSVLDFKKIKNGLLILYALLLAITVLSVVITAYQTPINQLSENFDTFDGDWFDSSGNEMNFEDITKNITVSKSLSDLKNDQTLFFRVKNLNLSVYKNGVLYKTFGGDITKTAWYKTPGTYFVSVPISKDDETVTLEIINPYKNDSSCNIKSMYIGDGDAIIQNQTLKLLPGFSTCILIILIGAIMCTLSVTLQKYDKKNSSLLALGLFALVLGIWSATETKLLQMLTGYSSVIHLVTSLTLMLIAVPIFIFFKDRGQATDKISVPLISAFTGLGFTVSMILHFAGIRDFHENIFIAHTVLGISCIFTVYYAFKILKKSHLKDPAFWGLLIIGLCAGIDIILYYKQITSDSSMFVRFGVLGYVTMLGVQIIGNYVETYSENMKTDMILKMAYYDILTGFYNHNSFMSDLKDINRNPNPHKQRAIIVFDMNCLKYINDHMGHAMGDSALKEAAEYIRDSFANIGKCYRIGGDEYAVITDNKTTEQELDEIYAEFQRKLTERNKTDLEKTYPLYIAGGYELIDTDAQNAFNAADAKMYDNKQQIKKELALQNAAFVRQ